MNQDHEDPHLAWEKERKHIEQELIAEFRLLTREARPWPPGGRSYQNETALAEAKVQRVEERMTLAALENERLQTEARKVNMAKDTLFKEMTILRTGVKGLQEGQAKEAGEIEKLRNIAQKLQEELVQEKQDADTAIVDFEKYKEEADERLRALRKEVMAKDAEIAKLHKKLNEIEKMGAASKIEAKLLNEWRDKTSMLFLERHDMTEGKMRKLQAINKKLNTQFQKTNENVNSYMLNVNAGKGK